LYGTTNDQTEIHNADNLFTKSVATRFYKRKNTAVDLPQRISIYFTDYTRFTALTTFCDEIYFENIIRLLAAVYVANGSLLSKMATAATRQ